LVLAVDASGPTLAAAVFVRAHDAPWQSGQGGVGMDDATVACSREEYSRRSLLSRSADPAAFGGTTIASRGATTFQAGYSALHAGPASTSTGSTFCQRPKT
jgi:hypothetical protein